jgi:hypothetical protein
MQTCVSFQHTGSTHRAPRARYLLNSLSFLRARPLYLPSKGANRDAARAHRAFLRIPRIVITDALELTRLC